MFAIWLEQLELRAIDQTGALLVGGPVATRRWALSRFGALLDRVGDAVGRQVRFADDRELQLLDAISSGRPVTDSSSLLHAQRSHDHKEAV